MWLCSSLFFALYVSVKFLYSSYFGTSTLRNPQPHVKVAKFGKHRTIEYFALNMQQAPDSLLGVLSFSLSLGLCCITDKVDNKSLLNQSPDSIWHVEKANRNLSAMLIFSK